MPVTTPFWVAVTLFLGSLIPGWDCPLRVERAELRVGHAIANNNSNQPSGFQLTQAMPSVEVPLTRVFGPSWARGRILWNPELEFGLFSAPYVRPLFGLRPFQFSYELQPHGRWALYGLSGFGGMYANVERPETGSDVNFSLVIGGGVRYAATPRTPWLLEYRHVHMSNNGTNPQNSGIDAHALFAGISTRF